MAPDSLLAVEEALEAQMLTKENLHSEKGRRINKVVLIANPEEVSVSA